MCHSALCDPNFYVLLSQIDATGLRRFAPPGARVAAFSTLPVTRVSRALVADTTRRSLRLTSCDALRACAVAQVSPTFSTGG